MRGTGAVTGSAVLLVVGGALFPALPFSCADEPDGDVAVAAFANTVPGHADVQVTASYRGSDIEDYWGAATEALQSGRFVVAYINGASPYGLYFRRYDVPGGGFMGSPTNLDSYTRNVRKAGMVSATEGGTTQGVAG